MARYAPSPTGPLHLGNLQTALGAWLQARLHGLGFILRIEDLDQARCRDEWTRDILRDLAWLGIDWDIGPDISAPEQCVQSRRLPLYREALDHLAQNGRLFACKCSRRELNDIASAPHGPLGTVYPGTCRGREIQQFVSNSHSSAEDSLRFRVPEGERRFSDKLAGLQVLDLATELGDFVVYRRDAVVAYHLAVVVDDIDMGVTDVFRGADLLWSVFPQVLLYEAMERQQPHYWHAPLRYDESGQRLAKRNRDTSIGALIECGYSAGQVTGQLAQGLGLLEEPVDLSCRELLNSLSPERFQKCLQHKLVTQPPA